MPVPQAEGSVSLLDYLLVLWADKWRLAALSLAGALLAFGGSFLMTPAYRATTVLLPISQDGGGGAVASLMNRLGGLASLVGMSPGGGTGRDEAVAYLRSRKLITDFITEKNLLPVLFSEDWDASRKAWASADAEDVPTLGDGYKLFDEQIRGISEDRRTGIVTFTVTWYDRQLAAQWANELVARANLALRERALVEGRRTISYLRDEASRAETVEVRQSIYRLIEEQIKAMSVASAREQYSFKVIDPAAVPELRERVRPRRVLFAAIGLVTFFLAGAFVVWLRHDLRRRSVA